MATPLKKRKVDDKDWTDRERMFVAEYCVDFNGTRAAIAAGYAKRTAPVMACKLLKKPKIKQAIGNVQHNLIRKKGLEREEVLQKVAENLHRDLSQLADENGYFHGTLDQIPKECYSWIDGFEVYQDFNKEGEIVGQKIKVKISPNAAIQDIAMKHIGGYAAEKVETTHSLNWEDLFNPPKESDDVEDEIKTIESSISNPE